MQSCDFELGLLPDVGRLAQPDVDVEAVDLNVKLALRREKLGVQFPVELAQQLLSGHLNPDDEGIVFETHLNVTAPATWPN